MMRLFLSIFLLIFAVYAKNAKNIFETYCWGCHHQTAEAFGPSFLSIAQKRTKDEIKAMILDPKNVSKAFGYKRNAMPKIKLNSNELDAIIEYIVSFKKSR